MHTLHYNKIKDFHTEGKLLFKEELFLLINFWLIHTVTTEMILTP